MDPTIRHASLLLVLGVIFVLGPALARCANLLRLPAITGYVGAGILVGSQLFGMVEPQMRPALGTTERLAGCLVVFAIGASLRFERLRSHARSVRRLAPAILFITAVALAFAQLAAVDWLPFLGPLSRAQRLLAALSLGILLASVSPTVVVAVRDELRADGPLTRTVLGAVVLADFAVVAVLLGLGLVWTGWLHTSAEGVGTVLELVRAIFGALAIGCALGVFLAYLGAVPTWLAVMTVMLATWAHSEAGRFGPVSALMVASSAGLVLANSGTAEPRLVTDLARALPTACAALFGIAGALIDIQQLRALLIPVAALVAVRFCGIWLAAAAAGRAGTFEGHSGRWAFAGLLPQAGFSLAMVEFLPALFPGFGDSARAVAVAVIYANEILMPPIWHYALQRAGEDGASLRPPAIGSLGA